MSNEYARMSIAKLRQEIVEKDMLIEELLGQIEELVYQLEKPQKTSNSLDQALNEGDGSYNP